MIFELLENIACDLERNGVPEHLWHVNLKPDDAKVLLEELAQNIDDSGTKDSKKQAKVIRNVVRRGNPSAFINNLDLEVYGLTITSYSQLDIH